MLFNENRSPNLRSNVNMMPNGIANRNKIPIRSKIMNVFILLSKLQLYIHSRKYSFYKKVMISFSKIYLFIIVLSVLLSYYYFYLFWNIVPFLESTKSGLSLEFWLYWSDIKYRNGIISYLLFHLFFMLFLLSMLKTIFCDPGELHRDYIDLYSLLNFLKIFFNYIIGHKDNNKNFSLKGTYKEIHLIIEDLIRMEPEVSRSLDAYNALVYNSIDVNSRLIDQTEENDMISKDVVDTSNINITKDIVEDILEPFESKIEELINQNESYIKFNNLKFMNDGSKKKLKRFCYFCLLKKPDRTHHCRICRKCYRKMDHHCHFLTTCIAYSNYKFFLLVLFYAIITLNFMIFTSFDSLKFYLNEYGGNNLYFVIYAIFLSSKVILNLVLVYFFGLHLYYLFKNVTTIENVEKVDKDTNSAYQEAWYNFKTVFGTNFLTWFLPILPDSKLNGYSFEVDDEKYSKMLLDKRESGKRAMN